MSADAVIRAGHAPWMPCAAARNLDVLYLSEVPTNGTFVVGEDTYMFACLSGHLDHASLWAYTKLRASEVKRAAKAEFDDLEQLQDWTDRLFSKREVLFATAKDFKVDRWSDPYAVDDDLLKQASRFLERLLTAEKISRRRPKRIAQVKLDAELRELEATFA